MQLDDNTLLDPARKLDFTGDIGLLGEASVSWVAGVIGTMKPSLLFPPIISF